jgi:DnaJ-class molecular chaperone
MDLNIKLTTALLGGEYTIPTLDGDIKVKIPAGVSIGEVLRVKGKGVLVDKGKRGDLLIKLHIQLPKKLSKKAGKLVEELKEEGI